jgi:NAD(P)-dependent dehydrogenase (short-subunit alcohol dehydrogenase family)
MKEHSFFLEAGFTPVNADLARQADAFKNQFETLLKEVVFIANGFISPDVASSGEIVTGFTLNAERATTFFTGIQLDTSITMAELSLTKGGKQSNIQTLVQRVADINQRVIVLLPGLINLKTIVLDSMLTCKIYTFNYPLLIDHIRREAILFLELLKG